MTLQSQKNTEILYANFAAEKLEEQWTIESAPDEENWPDLIVTTPSGKFGLEVRELYLDTDRKGSPARARETYNSKLLAKLAEAYYDICSVPINLQVIGDLEALIKRVKDVKNKAESILEHERCEFGLENGGMVYIHRLPPEFKEYRRGWQYVSDKVGFVSDMTAEVLNDAIEKKVKKLSKYKKNITDIRLLLVSNRIRNSGKAHLVDDISCDGLGFDEVYYLSYPEEIHSLTSAEV